MSANRNKNKGFGLIEAVVGTAVLLAVTIGAVSLYNFYASSVLSTVHRTKAALLLEEGIEAAKMIRDGEWTSNISPLSSETAYGLSWSGSSWSLKTGADSADGFYRTLSFAPVSRDASGAIVSNGGTVDPNTRLLTVNVSWQGSSATETSALSEYLTNIFSN